uniref:Chromosome 5 C1orf21 homolog n=2 Tax=Equus TaxID=9789 RepID=A0A9L0T9U9_HORSE
MGCASAKHVATVQNEEEAQKGKNYQNGDVFGDEYRIKPVEEVKYMKNGAEEEQKIAARNQENLEKSASSNVRLKTNKEIPGLVHQPRANMHISESQQEFFRMLDEKIEKEDWSPSFSAHKMFYATSTTNLEMTLGSDTL